MAAVNNSPSTYQPRDLSLPLSRSSRLYPQFGAFAVFTLDPVASLEALEDPAALDDARTLALSCKKYIGYVKGVLNLPMLNRKYHKCDCHILSRGLAIPSPTRHIDENMCTPVAPATHPLGRPAVAPIPALPLPWDDLFIHYNAFFTFRIKTNHHETDLSNSPMLSMADLFAVWQHKSEDGERQDTLFEEEWSRFRQLGDDDESVGNDAASQDEDDQVAESEYSDDDDFPEALHDALGCEEHPRDQFMPVVSYDFDLAAVTEFAAITATAAYELNLSSAHWRPCGVSIRSGKPESGKPESAKPESAKPESAKQESGKQGSRKQESGKQESARRPLRSLSMGEKAQVFARTLFSCIYQGKHFNEAEAN
ncbi:hypothetical protein FA95DRAFT_1576529 [Auriscalpium vulgare]|uniref:Uncharacterized protein n=1 Tax=Auriscalpium vulgare TaxID=40419 RepID=A0ACB8RC13_9AGAM|nr:hypothetical protein FA95DRAFT_1576529 [Auriscalpium vulgare]